MLTQELKDIIESLKDTQSDTSFVEVNSCADDFPKRMWETVSAFSNALGGGVIILGVDERDKDVKIVGVNEPFEFQKLLRKTCSSMTPAVEALIEIHNIDGKLLVTAEIPEASYKEKPVFYQGSGMISGSFIRDNHDDRPLTQYEVQSLLDGRGQPRYDCEPVKDSSINDLDPERLRLFLSRVRENNQAIREWDDEKILHTYHVLVSYEGKNVATLAGILCFGLYPQQFFPSLVTQVMVYPPKSSNG